MHACAHVCIWAYVCVHVCAHAFTRVCTRAHTHACMCLCMQTLPTERAGSVFTPTQSIPAGATDAARRIVPSPPNMRSDEIR